MVCDLVGKNIRRFWSNNCLREPEVVQPARRPIQEWLRAFAVVWEKRCHVDDSAKLSRRLLRRATRQEIRKKHEAGLCKRACVEKRFSRKQVLVRGVRSGSYRDSLVVRCRATTHANGSTARPLPRRLPAS